MDFIATVLRNRFFGTTGTVAEPCLHDDRKDRLVDREHRIHAHADRGLRWRRLLVLLALPKRWLDLKALRSVRNTC